MGFTLSSPSSGAQPFQGATCDDVLDVGEIGADQNDFAPTSAGSLTYQNASTWEIYCSLALTLSGMKGGIKGRRVVLTNVGVDNITIPNESESSEAANRFNFSTVLLAGNSITVQYSGILSRWVLVAMGANAAQGLQGASVVVGGMTPGEWQGGNVTCNNGTEGIAGGVSISGGAASPTGFGGNITIAGGFSEEGFNGSIILQSGNDLFATIVSSGGEKTAAFTAWKLGFNDAAPVAKQSITGATTQLQVDSLVAALVAFGLVSDDR